MQNTVTYDSQTIIQLFRLGLYALITLAISFTVLGIVAFRRAPQDRNPAYTFSQLFVRAKALQMMAVILIVVAAVLLSLCKTIDPNGTVAILSGIAGYVLGGLHKEPSRTHNSKEPSSSEARGGKVNS